MVTPQDFVNRLQNEQHYKTLSCTLSPTGLITSLSNENADVPEVMISNRKFDISLDGTLLSHTTNWNAFVLIPAVEFVESEHGKRESINFRLPFLTFGTSTFSKVANIKHATLLLLP